MPLQLGLADGATYQLDIFAAQRHRADPSQIQLVTSVDFASGEPVSTFCAGGSTPPRVSSGPLILQFPVQRIGQAYKLITNSQLSQERLRGESEDSRAAAWITNSGQ